MRIALFDLSPYAIGGDVTWCQTVRYGLTELGHDVTYLRWSRVDRIPSATRYTGPTDLIGYDAVIFSEVAADLRQSDINLVRLIRWVNARDVPTIVGVHGNLSQYAEPRRVLMINALLAASHPWATTADMLDDVRVAEVRRHAIERPFLPFRTREFGHWPEWNATAWELRQGLMITGRICTPKGQHVLAAIADRLVIPLIFCGQAQFKSARNLLEQVIDDGGRVVGEWPTGWSSSWEATTPSGNRVVYVGGYTDASEVPWHAATAHVNLTTKKMSIGHLEYSTLEAVDAGLRAGVPNHALSNGFYHSVHGFNAGGYHSTKELKEAPTMHLDVLVGELNELGLMGPTSRDGTEKDLDLHDPVRYAAALVDL